VAKIFLIAHVLAAIVAVGPVTVAASMFPAVTRRALAEPSPQATAGVRILHRICRVYAVLGVLVPFFGLATAGSMHVMGDAWVIVSIGLTALAAAVLGLLVLPRQAALLAGLDTPRTPPGTPMRLAMYTGTFNLLWAAVTVLMIVRPGSTTGA
jgi:hypothetical protein